MTLTNDQTQALNKLIEWYKSDRLVFTLYGAAGTGKTFLLRKFLDETVKYGIAVTAPTHKAVRVAEKATNRKGKTFQSLHGLRPNYNLESFNIDNIKFDTIGEEQIKNYRLVVVDECSQVGNGLHRLNILRSATYKVKIVYVGDALQLCPVDRDEELSNSLSPVFEVDDKFELTEIVRQNEDNPLLVPLSLLRTDIVTGGSRFLAHINKYPAKVNADSEGYICVGMNEFKRLLIERFKSDGHKKDGDYVRYLAWRNVSINSWNKFIRDIVYNKPQDILIKDDLLLGYTNIVDPNNFMESIVTNSTPYTISSIERTLCPHGFDVFETVIEDGEGSKLVNIVDHQSPTFKRFYNLVNNLHKEAIYSQPATRGRNWSKYYEFKNQYLLINEFTLNDNAEDGKSSRGTVKKDLDYGYGITTHKAQGSTIKYVFINLVDMIYFQGDKTRPIVNTRYNPTAIDLRNRLIYTSLSRTSKLAIILV